MFNLANDLLYCDQWDPTTLPPPYAPTLPDPEQFPDNIPVGKAEESNVKMEPCILGGAEGYIDDGACAVLDTIWNCMMVARACQAVVVALFLIICPLAGLLEPIKRPVPASIRKMLAEGRLKEIITFLGWIVDTRQLPIALPINTWRAWSTTINEAMNKKTTSSKEIETLIGKLNHVCFIIPDARHFMNNLRKAEQYQEENDV